MARELLARYLADGYFDKALLSGFFFCFQSDLLFVFDLFLFYLFVEVAPVAARDDELVDLEFRMNALCPVKQIRVERIGCVKPDAG
jgi:hypothetical protein